LGLHFRSAAEWAYIRTRAQDDAFYAKLLMDYLEKFGKATRAEVDDLLLSKLSFWMKSKSSTRSVIC